MDLWEMRMSKIKKWKSLDYPCEIDLFPPILWETFPWTQIKKVWSVPGIDPPVTSELIPTKVQFCRSKKERRKWSDIGRKRSLEWTKTMSDIIVEKIWPKTDSDITVDSFLKSKWIKLWTTKAVSMKFIILRWNVHLRLNKYLK